MAGVEEPRVNARLVEALEDGDSMAVIKRLLASVRQETFEAIRFVFAAAMSAEEEVFQVVLDAMCKEVIVPPHPCKESLLSLALEMDDAEWRRKEIVMAVVERMEKEMPCELDSYAILQLFMSDLFDDQEVVDAVVGVTPPGTFGITEEEDDDCLTSALACPSRNVERAVELVMKLGPSMEQRLEGQERFRYVRAAAQYGDVSAVEMMHDLVPLLADGSGKRGEVEDYAHAVEGVIFRFYANGDVLPILQYLVETGGSECLEECDPCLVLFMATKEDADWVITRAPYNILQEACCQTRFLDTLLRYSSRILAYIVKQIAELVAPNIIALLMQQKVPDSHRAFCGAEGWRWQLEGLHKAVPKCMDGLRWKWLIESIDDKAYKDVEYMIGMCTRDHLKMRNEEGETAYDVAAKDEQFPRRLRDRLAVAAKGAHA